MHTLRLICEYDRMDVRLVDVLRVEMIIPLRHLPEVPPGAAGCWIEMQDAQGRVLYREPRRNPIRHAIEASGSPDSDEPMWYPIKHPRGGFDLLVPDLPQARVLALWCSPPEAPGTPAAELVRLRLDARQRAVGSAR